MVRPARLERATSWFVGRRKESTGGSGTPLPLVFIRKLATRDNPPQPRAATDCQSFVSRLRPPSLVITVQQTLQQKGIDSKIGFTKAGNGGRKFNQAALGSSVQHAKRTCHDQTQPACFVDTLALVHQDQIGLHLQREEYGVTLAAIQTGKRALRRRTCYRSNLEPGRWVHDPLTNHLRRPRLPEFIGYGLGDQYLGVKGREYVRVIDQDEVSERRGVGNDDARHGSEAKSTVCLPVLLQIAPRIIQPNLAFFQEAIQLVLRRKPQKAPELRRSELAFPIRFESDRLEGCTGQISARRSEGGRKFVRNVQHELHVHSIATESSASYLAACEVS